MIYYHVRCTYRPPDPIEYVAVFLLKNKDKYKRY